MKKFSYVEIHTLRLGMEIEIAEDFRVNEAMPRETFNLWMDYCGLSALETLTENQKIELEVTYKALHRMYVFWDIYFTYGKKYAVSALRKSQEKEREMLEKRHEEIMENLINEVEELIADEA